MEENTQQQDKKQKYDWLKGYQFVKGKSGNPGGRKKGSKSLKVFAREYLERLPANQKIEYLKTLPEDLVWRMAEGNPDTKLDTPIDDKLKNEDKKVQKLTPIFIALIKGDYPNPSTP